MVNRLFELSTTFTKLAPLTTDYGKASMNSAVMAELGMPYFNEDGERVTPKADNYLKGYMMQGFGWSVQNIYEDLLPLTGAQSTATRFMQGAGQFLNVIGVGNKLPFVQDMPGKALMSLQQTIAVWMGMKKPEFQITLLFFDSKGESTTDVTIAAHAIERALYPRVNNIAGSDFSLTMNAPGGYIPYIRNPNNTPNKTYSMSAEGLSVLHIGKFISFNEIICTGANMQFSNVMLENGKPQWMTATFNFILWKQPSLSDLKNRYK